MTTPSELDPELAALLMTIPEAPPLGASTLAAIRPYARPQVETALAGYDLHRNELMFSSFDGADTPVTVLKPTTGNRLTGPTPCVFWVHGGGMVMGNQYSQIDIPLDWMIRFGVAVVSVDYRLAPEVGGMTLVEDCFAGLAWAVEHASDLNIDANQIIIAGTSGGGGLAAGTTLLARDRNGPAIAAQMLICPMLDHRNNTPSSVQLADAPVWSREANAFGWRSVLNDTAGDAVPAYISPARADDLSGLPPTFIDVGAAEIFRDEDVTYAARIWEAGGQVELHVWAGGFHGFDALFPHARLSQTARRTRSDWLERVLAPAAALKGPSR